MSLEILVIPTTPAARIWSVLASMASQQMAPKPIRDLLGNRLERMSPNGLQPIPMGTDLAMPFFGGIMLGDETSIGLSMSTTVHDYATEADFVEDYGRNIPATAQPEIIRSWTLVGWEATLAVGGVSEYHDPAIGAMLWFGAVFAEHHSGFVAMTESHLSYLPVGIYTPDEMRTVVQRTWTDIN